MTTIKKLFLATPGFRLEIPVFSLENCRRLDCRPLYCHPFFRDFYRNLFKLVEANSNRIELYSAQCLFSDNFSFCLVGNLSDIF